jgi:hypothetical protein
LAVCLVEALGDGVGDALAHREPTTHHVIVLRNAGLVRVEQTGSKKYLVRQYSEVLLPLR